LKLASVAPLRRFDHVLTHRKMRFHAFRARAQGRVKLAQYEAARWLPPSKIVNLGISAWATRLVGDA
jgi:hypothetical protein